MKECTCCRIKKPYNDFYKIKNKKTGSIYLISNCKECCKKKVLAYVKKYPDKNRERVKRYYYKHHESEKIKCNLRSNKFYHRRKSNLNVFICIVYRRMKSRVIQKRYKNYYGMPICSWNEFKDFALKNKILPKLYKNWMDNNYLHRLIPTVDRIDNLKGYTLDNIQFLTLSENSKKGSLQEWHYRKAV